MDKMYDYFVTAPKAYDAPPIHAFTTDNGKLQIYQMPTMLHVNMTYDQAESLARDWLQFRGYTVTRGHDNGAS